MHFFIKVLIGFQILICILLFYVIFVSLLKRVQPCKYGFARSTEGIYPPSIVDLRPKKLIFDCQFLQ